MKSIYKAGLAIAAMSAGCLSLMAPATAGDLYERSAGSMKDAPMVQHHGAAGRCYLRGDVGYSVSGETAMHLESPNYIPRGIDNEDLGNAWMGEIGIGCGQGATRGFRADLTLGYRGERDIDGYKGARNLPDGSDGIHFPATLDF